MHQYDFLSNFRIETFLQKTYRLAVWKAYAWKMRDMGWEPWLTNAALVLTWPYHNYIVMPGTCVFYGRCPKSFVRNRKYPLYFNRWYRWLLNTCLMIYIIQKIKSSSRQFSKYISSQLKKRVNSKILILQVSKLHLRLGLLLDILICPS